MKECFPAANISGVYGPTKALDATAHLDLDDIERKLIATMTEHRRLNTPRGTQPGILVPGAEGVMMFSFGKGPEAEQLLAVARAAMNDEIHLLPEQLG